MLRGVANASDLHLPHTCYRTDPSIFGRFCHDGDYCLDGVAYSCGLMGGAAHKHGAALEALASKRGYGSSDAHTCPLTEDIVRRGPFPMACLFLPRGPPAQPSAMTPAAFLDAASGAGAWNCVRNTWEPMVTPAGILLPPTRSSVDAIATYGDSLAHNIAIGVELTLNGFHADKFYHDRNDYIPEPSGGLPVAHFCCALCGCGHDSANATAHPFGWARDRGSKHLLLVVRTSLHEAPQARVLFNKAVRAMTDELQLLLQRARDFRGRVTVLWIPQHGAGKSKLFKWIHLGQDTESLRVYDDAVRVGVIGNATWADVQGLSVGVLNTTTMFQAAESSCEGAYGSLDGTHLSPTVQVNAAQQVLGLRSIL